MTTTTHFQRPHVQRIANLVWLVFMVVSLGLWGMKLVKSFHDAPNINPELAALLANIGFPATFPSYFKIFLDVCIMLAILTLCALIFMRRSNDWLALFTGTMLFLTAFGYTGARVNDYGVLMLVYITYVALMETSQVTFFYLFPNGQFLPRFARWLVAPFFVFRWLIWLNIYQNNLPQGAIEVGFVILLLFIGIGFQVYRYRRFATPNQRQQVKWVLAGFTITIVLVAPSVYVVSIIPLAESGFNYLTYNVVLILRTIALFIAPLALGFSVLRYRLWDIDLTINRSLVASAVTIVLVVVFTAVVFSTNALLSQWLSGDALVVGIIIAGIATGAAFMPTRRLVRQFIDRRLYGFRFDLNELKRGQYLSQIQKKGVYSGQTWQQYHLLDVIGRGGMGEVYKAFDGSRTVALKVLPEELAEPDTLRRFEREIQALQSLQHPSVVQYYSANLQHTPPYLVVEFIDGQDLATHLSQTGAWSAEDALQLMKELVEAVAHVHQQGFVHRDIKPANVMLRPNLDGETFAPILMDFGVVKLRDATQTLTGTGAVGTIYYMAPEQIQQSKTVDTRADLYALGAMWYELVTGKTPFEGNAGQVLFAHIQQPAPDPRKLQPDLPEWQARAILKALEKDPDARFEQVAMLVRPPA